jgi:hypothetical protein
MEHAIYSCLILGALTINLVRMQKFKIQYVDFPSSFFLRCCCMLHADFFYYFWTFFSLNLTRKFVAHLRRLDNGVFRPSPM